MMQPTNRNGKLIANFPPHRPLFCKLDVMSIRRGSAANETGLRGHKLQVFAVTLRHGFADDGNFLLAKIGLEWLIVSAIRLLMLRYIRLKFVELAQPGCKGILDRQGICR